MFFFYCFYLYYAIPLIIKFLNTEVGIVFLTAFCTLIIAIITVIFFDKIRVKRNFLNEQREYVGNYLGACLSYINLAKLYSVNKELENEMVQQFLKVQQNYAHLMIRFGKASKEDESDNEHDHITKLQTAIEAFHPYNIESHNNSTKIYNTNFFFKTLKKEIDNVTEKMEEFFVREWKKINRITF